MKIAHIAVWVNDMEMMKSFYLRYFHVRIGNHYHNPAKDFESCFIFFDEGPSVELMSRTNRSKTESNSDIEKGYAHLAVSVGSEEKVNALTKKLANDGYSVLSYPRITGDGYFESLIADPEGNLIEITI